jgi:AcrR family transcriptional regulator
MGTIPVAGRRERRKESTRRQLLVAGRRLFGRKGLYESRVDDLTSVAGIAKGTLYGYFADKEALVEAVVVAGFGELLDRVREAVGRARTRRQLVEAMARAHLEFYSSHPDLMRIFHQVRGMLKFPRPEGRVLRAALRGHLAGLASLLATRTNGRRMTRQERDEVARLLFGSVSGVSSVRAALRESLASAPRIRATSSAISAIIERPGGVRRRAPARDARRRRRGGGA